MSARRRLYAVPEPQPEPLPLPQPEPVELPPELLARLDALRPEHRAIMAEMIARAPWLFEAAR